MSSDEFNRKMSEARKAWEGMSEEDRIRLRKLQGINFAYGNLAASSNHKPERETFRKVALETLEMTEEEFETWAEGKEWER